MDYWWLQLYEWDAVGVPVFRYAESAKAELYIYTVSAMEDLEMEGASQRWKGATVEPLLCMLQPEVCYSLYRMSDEKTLSDMCRKTIGQHAIPTIISPAPLQLNNLPCIINAWRRGDPLRTLMRIHPCGSTTARWLYFLGYYYNECTTILLSVDAKPLYQIASLGQGLEDFKVIAASIPRLTDIVSRIATSSVD